MTETYRQARLEKELVALLPALRAFCHRFERKPEDVEDLVQETVVKVLANLDKFTDGTSLKSWMFTIARNSFCTRFGIRKRSVLGQEEFIARRASSDAPQEWSLQLRDFNDALVSLPSNQRLAIEIIVLQGQSYEDAATSFGCPIGTIKSRVNRARQTLADRMTGSPISVSSER